MTKKKQPVIDIADDSETPRQSQPVQLSPAMVCSANRNGYAGTGDLRPPVYRAGSMDAFTLPSRVGSRLHYPGRADTGDAA